MVRKSTLREIRTSLARYLAIFAIVALGVGFFSGLKDCKASMVNTAAEYIDGHNMYDYQLISSYGIDDESVSMARGWDGVSDAEGSVQIDVMAELSGGDEMALKAISLPENINTLRVVTGRLPEAPDECLIDDYHIDSEGFSAGDTIVLTDANDKDRLKNFRYREFKVVGTVNTPIYLDYQRGTTDIGSGSLETFFFIDRDAFDTDYYTQLYLTLDGAGGAFTQEKEDALKSSEDSMKDLAEKITAARRESAMADAQEELDEKEQEYQDSLAEYEDEKARAEVEIAKAEKKLADGQKQINSGRKKADAAIDDLNDKEADLIAKLAEVDAGIEQAKSMRSEAQYGLETAKAGKTDLESGIAGINALIAQAEQKRSQVDPDDTETLAAIDAELEALRQQLDGAEQQLSAVNGKISEAEEGIKAIDGKIAELESARAQITSGLSQVESGLSQAEDGLDELSRQQKKLDKGRKELASEKEKAETEFEKAERELEDARDKLDEAQQKILYMETGNSYALSVLDNAGYSSFDSNSSIVSNIAKIFPVFFFLIAALVCMTTMTRMVDEQRTQIGILKALGYSNAQIVGKYMFYSGSAAFLGAVTGFFIGCKVFPAVIWKAYTMMYDFSDTVDFVLDIRLGLVSLAAALICSMGATWVSIARDFTVPPSDLIRPRTPPAGRRILLERITPLWKRISFLYKVSIRNIFRDKKRFLMMVLGVSGCTALLIAGLGIRTTIAKVADHQFDEISLYDFNVVFSRNMNENRQDDFAEYMEENTGAERDEIFFLHQAKVTAVSGSGSYEVGCTAADEEDFGRYIDLHSGDDPIAFPARGEVVVVRKLSHDYGYKAGDTITIRDGYKEAEFTISGVCDNYVYDNIYMSSETYEDAFGKKPEIKSALIRLSQAGSDPDADDEAFDEHIREAAAEAAGYKDSAAVTVTLDTKDSVSKMMKSLDMVVYVVILSAALLAFIVLYNLTNINITERIREIATIKVLGFNQLEVTQYVFRENIFMTAVAAVLGIPLGKWLLGFVIDNIVVKMIYFEPRLSSSDYAIAVVLTFVFALAVNLAMQRRLANVSMTESLKSVE